MSEYAVELVEWVARAAASGILVGLFLAIIDEMGRG